MSGQSSVQSQSQSQAQAQSTAAPASPPSPSALRLAGLGLSAMLVPLGSTMIAVGLPSIGAEFGRSPSDLTQWLVNSYLLMSVVAVGPGGKLGDHWGYQRTLHLGQAIFGVGCLLPILVHTFGALVASRVLMALGGALMVPTVMAVFRIAVPAEHRHRVFGFLGALLGFSAALGPSLGGALVQHLGWSSIFWMNVPVLLVSAGVSSRFFAAAGHGTRSGGLRFDAIGTVVLTGSLAAFVVGLRGQPLWLLPAVGLMLVFVAWERRTPHPLVDLALFARRHFAAGCSMVALQNFGMYALLFLLPYLLGSLFHWGPAAVGPVMTSFMVSNMVASMLGGRIAERVGIRATTLVGSLMSAGGLGWLSMVSSTDAPAGIVGCLVVAGMGLGLANGPSQSAAMGTVEHASSGIASGVLATSRYLGGIAGIAILGLLLAGPIADVPAIRFRESIMAFALSFVLAAVVSVALPGREPAQHD